MPDGTDLVVSGVQINNFVDLLISFLNIVPSELTDEGYLLLYKIWDCFLVVCTIFLHIWVQKVIQVLLMGQKIDLYY